MISFKEINKLCIIALCISNLYMIYVPCKAQEISFNQKKAIYHKYKIAIEDSIQNINNIPNQFLIGRYHKPFNNKFNHPYISNNWVNGSINYNGNSYPATSLKYDIQNDKLILLATYDNIKTYCIALDENFVKSFTIENTKFKYYKELHHKSGRKLKDGYFEVVYDRKLKFIVKKEKHTVISDNTSLPTFKESITMFLIKNHQVIPINSMSKLLNQLKDKKIAMKKFIKKNYLKLNSYNYTSIPKILYHYESLN